MNEAKTVKVSVSCKLTIRGEFTNVKQLEEAIRAEVRSKGVWLYEAAAGAYQQGWLHAHADRYLGVCWRERRMVTPLGVAQIPNRVVRERGKARGGYQSLAKMLWRGKATRLLSPELEREALEAATQQNYRPAARRISAGCGKRISHWMVWRCVQVYGEKLREHQQRDWWMDRPLGIKPEVVVTEVDSTYLKRQRWGQRRRAGTHFMMHVGLHYTGRERRCQRAGRRDVVLRDKTFLVSSESIGIFGSRLRKQRDRHYGMNPSVAVTLSDGDEGLERMREQEFGDTIWLLDRWHVAENVRSLVGTDQAAYRRVMAGVYASDSEAVLEALRQMAPRYEKHRFEEFRNLFGYLLGNREGIDAFRQVPAHLRRSRGRSEAAVRPGSGAAEKNVEIHINRRFKKQGRSWNPIRADRLAQLYWLQTQPNNWTHWWNQVCLSTVKINPGWPSH